jgi:hypothetical protein
MPAMADWRQIQARIRKAKNSTDARTKLNELYQRTRDAMVSWELAAVEEKAERLDEAIKWYTISAERFRRADWKKKAEDALARLGAPIPAQAETSGSHAQSAEKSEEGEPNGNVTTEEPRKQLAVGEIAAEEDTEESDEADDESEDSSDEATEGESQAEVAGSGATAGSDDASQPGKKKRRRGRRGGRGRRRKTGSPQGTALPAQAFAENRTQAASEDPAPAPHVPRNDAPNFRSEAGDRRPSAYAAEHDHAPRANQAEAAPPMLPSERTAHGRAGDPALASRMAKLDSMLRRLVASPLHKMDDVDGAPAGPGVFLLSDSDQITSYYVEACQTLRVGLGNLARGGGRQSAKPQRSGGRPTFETSGGLKSKLAEHLGIGEAKVSQYLKDHCVVRWIQLDDDAPHLAHFAIGVLRTPLNMD